MTPTPTSNPLPPPPAYIARSSSSGSATSSQSQSATSVSSSVSQGHSTTTGAATGQQQDNEPVRGRRSSISKSVYQGYADDHPNQDPAVPTFAPLPPMPTDMTVSANIHFEDDNGHQPPHPSADHYYSRPSSPTLESASHSPALPTTTTTILEDFHHSHQNHYLVPLPPAAPSSSSSSPFAFFANSIATSSSSSAAPPTPPGEHSSGPATHYFPTSSASSKTLRIELAQSEVVLMAGQVTTLEGVLYVNVHKTTKVKTLQLEFSGRSSVTWVDGKQLWGSEREDRDGHGRHGNGGGGGGGGESEGGGSNSGGSIRISHPHQRRTNAAAAAAAAAAVATAPAASITLPAMVARPRTRATALFSSNDLVSFSEPSYSPSPSSPLPPPLLPRPSPSSSSSCSNTTTSRIDNAYSPATRHTTAPHIEHTWDFITHQHKQPSEQLQPGQHAYPFALELPDTLPETLTTTHGKVSYRLTATLVKPGFSLHSSTITLPVTILRKYPTHSTRSYQRGGRAISKPEDKVQFKIVVPQTRVPHSTKVPLQVSITAPTPRIHVNVLQVGLWERVVYRADGRRRVDVRLVKIQKSEGWPQERNTTTTTGHHEATTWNKVLLFDMPPMGGSELSHCNPSADNGLMKVTHMLRFSILGLDGSKRFRVESEVDIKVLAFEDQLLPRILPSLTEDDADIALRQGGGDDPQAPLLDPELPSYLTSFSTPRVSFDAERDMDPVMTTDDDLLRSMLAGIHLPTYAESEEDVNSRATSRSVSRVVSRSTSRAPSRAQSPERSSSSPAASSSTAAAAAPGSSQAHGYPHHHQHHAVHYHHSSHYHHPATTITATHAGASNSNNNNNNIQDGAGRLSVQHPSSPHHSPHLRAASPLRSAV